MIRSPHMRTTAHSHSLQCFRVVLLFILVGVITGCAPVKRHLGIFDNADCEPPCWQNITPGITTKDEAVKILSGISWVNLPSQVTQAGSADKRYEIISFALFEYQNYPGLVSFFSRNDRIFLVSVN